MNPTPGLPIMNPAHTKKLFRIVFAPDDCLLARDQLINRVCNLTLFDHIYTRYLCLG